MEGLGIVAAGKGFSGKHGSIMATYAYISLAENVFWKQRHNRKAIYYFSRFFLTCANLNKQHLVSHSSHVIYIKLLNCPFINNDIKEMQ